MRITTRLLAESRLTVLAADGDRAASETIYRRHHQPVYRYCRIVLGRADDAEQALRGALVRSFATLPLKPDEVTLRPWLFRIAREEAAAVQRRRELPRVGADAIPLEDAVLASPRLRDLAAALRDLSEPQLVALVLRELHRLPPGELAFVLSTTPAGAEQLAGAARAALNELVAARIAPCAAHRQALERGPGLRSRGPRLRAHLRDCVDCRAFRDRLDGRGGDLALLAPALSSRAASRLLRELLAGTAEAPSRRTGKTIAACTIAAAATVTVAGAAAMGGGAEPTVNAAAAPTPTGELERAPARGATRPTHLAVVVARAERPAAPAPPAAAAHPARTQAKRAKRAKRRHARPAHDRALASAAAPLAATSVAPAVPAATTPAAPAAAPSVEVARTVAAPASSPPARAKDRPRVAVVAPTKPKRWDTPASHASAGSRPPHGKPATRPHAAEPTTRPAATPPAAAPASTTPPPAAPAAPAAAAPPAATAPATPPAPPAAAAAAPAVTPAQPEPATPPVPTTPPTGTPTPPWTPGRGDHGHDDDQHHADGGMDGWGHVGQDGSGSSGHGGDDTGEGHDD